jgi:hypothetical protein
VVCYNQGQGSCQNASGSQAVAADPFCSADGNMCQCPPGNYMIHREQGNVYKLGEIYCFRESTLVRAILASSLAKCLPTFSHARPLSHHALIR